MPISNIWVTLADLIPAVGGLWAIKHLGKGMRIFFFYCLMALPFDLLNLTLRIYEINNFWVLHVFTLCEYALIAATLSVWATSGLQKLIRFSITGFIVVWIISKFFIESFSTYDNFMSTTESVLLIILTTTILTRLSTLTENFDEDPRFWVLIALLFYFAGNFTVFALRNYLYFWYIHNIILTITNILIFKAFLCSRNPLNSGLY